MAQSEPKKITQDESRTVYTKDILNQLAIHEKDEGFDKLIPKCVSKYFKSLDNDGEDNKADDSKQAEEDSNNDDDDDDRIEVTIWKFNPPSYEDNGKWCYLLEDVFTENECQELINFCNDSSFEKNYHCGLLNVGNNKSIEDKSNRNHSRLLIDSESIAKFLFSKLEKYLPPMWPIPKDHQFNSKYDAMFDKNNTIYWQNDDDIEYIGYDINKNYDNDNDNDSKEKHDDDHDDNDNNEFKIVGLNERLRFLKYDKGEFFKPHWDGSYKREPVEIKNEKNIAQFRIREESFVTVLIYLNDNFQGGETTLINGNVEYGFFDHEKWCKISNNCNVTNKVGFKDHIVVKPQQGAVLLFQHDIFHEGSTFYGAKNKDEIVNKYLIRTDVMYKKKEILSHN